MGKAKRVRFVDQLATTAGILYTPDEEPRRLHRNATGEPNVADTFIQSLLLNRTIRTTVLDEFGVVPIAMFIQVSVDKVSTPEPFPSSLSKITIHWNSPRLDYQR